MPFQMTTKAPTAEGLLDADLQNALVPTIGPRIPDKVCLSSYLANVMRLCSLYLTPAAKLLNVLERSIMFAAYIFSVVTTSRVQNPHIKVVTGNRFTNSQRHRVIEVDFFPCHRCIVHQEAVPTPLSSGGGSPEDSSSPSKNRRLIPGTGRLRSCSGNGRNSPHNTAKFVYTDVQPPTACRCL